MDRCALQQQVSAPFVYGWALATRVHIWSSSRHLPSPDPTDLWGEAAGDPPVKPLRQGCAGGGSAPFLSPPSFPPPGCVSQEKSDCGGGFYGRGSKSLAWVQPPSAQLSHRLGLGFWAREAEGDGGSRGRGLGTGGHRAAALMGMLLSSAQRWQQHGWVLLVSHPSLGVFKATDLRDPQQGRQSHREDIN